MTAAGVVNVKWLWVGQDAEPEWVELTLASGRVIRYRIEGR